MKNNNSRQYSKGKKRNRGKQYKAESSNTGSRGNASNHGERDVSKLKEEKEFPDSKGRNDYAWYSRNPQIIKDAASIPFSWATGLPFNIEIPNSNGQGVVPVGDNQHVIPGIMVQYLIPSVGYSDNPESPLNTAALAQYSFLTHANSRNQTYNAPDAMIYLLAMSQVYSYINYLIRVYDSISMYKTFNRYVPRTLVNVMGANFDNIINNLANFRYGINMLIAEAASLCVPSTMSIFNRHAFLYQNLYAEGDSIKDQLYLYSPRGFWMFDDSGDTGGHLNFVEFFNPAKGIIEPSEATDHKTYSELLDFGQLLLRPLISNDEVQLMSADILKAYGSVNLIKLGLKPESYVFEPVYTDLDVLEQMQNATILGERTIDFDSLIVQQNPENVGYLLFQPKVNYTTSLTTPGAVNQRAANCYYQYAGSKLLTTIRVEPSPEEVIEKTRLSVLVSQPKFTSGSSGTPAVFTGNIISGSEIPSSCYVISLGKEAVTAGVGTTQALYSHRIVYEAMSTDMSIQDMNRIGAALQSSRITSPFKFIPTTTTSVYLNSSAGSVAYDPIISGRIDNYAVIAPETLRKMHEAAIFNELFVPPVNLM